ncbi:MAG: glycosyltransferase [Labilithrix sp.]|nr:glycosyltransferase [Labilithrix sp.]MCW5814725.1 glycosyltransferase [Labilithrix sp.]
MRALYISQTGMLEGLGSSQVLAYLRRLAQRGVEFDLLSYELPEATDDEIDRLRADLTRANIRWAPLRRRRDPRLSVKVRESALGAHRALATALARRPVIVHGRSYLPTAIADVVASVVPRAKLLFDCRGMIGDEYVDASYWTTDRIEYRLVKRYEARAFRRAEGVVFLTDALRRWIGARGWLGARTEVETIPCCVDLDAFRFDRAARDHVRQSLGWEDDLVLVYAGSLGSWYREDEIARFAGVVRRRAAGRRVRFLLLSKSAPEALVGLLRAAGLDESSIAVRGVQPDKMPQHLSAADIGISFIKSCFSKKGSSPTKVAEYLACGLPVVLNGDIGDQADLAAEAAACIVLDSYDDEALAAGADRAVALATAPLADRVTAGRDVADRRFGLERVGVARYERLYRALERDQS